MKDLLYLDQSESIKRRDRVEWLFRLDVNWLDSPHEVCKLFQDNLDYFYIIFKKVHPGEFRSWYFRAYRAYLKFRKIYSAKRKVDKKIEASEKITSEDKLCRTFNKQLKKFTKDGKLVDLVNLLNKLENTKIKVRSLLKLILGNYLLSSEKIDEEILNIIRYRIKYGISQIRATDFSIDLNENLSNIFPLGIVNNKLDKIQFIKLNEDGWKLKIELNDPAISSIRSTNYYNNCPEEINILSEVFSVNPWEYLVEDLNREIQIIVISKPYNIKKIYFRFSMFSSIKIPIEDWNYSDCLILVCNSSKKSVAIFTNATISGLLSRDILKYKFVDRLFSLNDNLSDLNAYSLIQQRYKISKIVDKKLEKYPEVLCLLKEKI